MAQAPIYVANDVRVTDTIRVDNVGKQVAAVADTVANVAGSILDQKAKKDAFKQGVEAQMLTSDKLVEHEGGIFGPTITSESFNEGAKLAYKANKDSQLNSILTEVQTSFEADPNFDFKGAFLKARTEFLKGVPIEQAPIWVNDFDTKTNTISANMGRMRVTRERQGHYASILSSVENDHTSAVNDLAAGIDIDLATERVIQARAKLAETVKLFPEFINPVQVKQMEDAMFFKEREADAVRTYNSLPIGKRLEYIQKMQAPDGNYHDLEFDQRRTIAAKLGAMYSVDKAKLDAAQVHQEMFVDRVNAALEGGANVSGEDLTRAKGFALGLAASGKKDDLTRLQNFNVALTVNARVDSFAKMNAQNQEVVMRELQAQLLQPQSASEQYLLVKTLTAIERKRSELNSAFGRDPIEGASIAGYQIPVLDLNKPESWEQYRQARRAAQIGTGREIPYLTKQVETDLKRVFTEGTVDEATAFIGRLGQVPDSELDRQKLFRQIAEKQPEISVVANLVQTGNVQTAKETIASARWVQRNGTRLKGVDQLKNSITQLVAQTLPVGMDPEGEMFEQMTSAATNLALYQAYRGVETGDINIDAVTLSDTKQKQVVANIFGYQKYDDIPELNDSRFVGFRPGMTHDQVMDRLSVLNDDDLVAASGVNSMPIDEKGRPITAARLRDEGRLMPIGNGEYRLMFEDGRNPGNWFPALVKLPDGRQAPYKFNWSNVEGVVEKKLEVGALVGKPERVSTEIKALEQQLRDARATAGDKPLPKDERYIDSLVKKLEALNKLQTR